MDTPDLLARLRSGDRQAFAALVVRYQRPLFGFLGRMGCAPALAEDLAQDAFVRAWQQAPNWQPGAARFATWLHQVVLNLCRDRLRTRREMLPLESVAERVDDDTPEHAHGRADRAHRIQTALATLPERQREALLLCHFQGLSNIEAAGLLALSVDALESLLARGRRALRAALTAVGEPTLGAGA